MISRRSKDILVVDIETGNLNLEVNNFEPDNCTICEIGIVNLNLDTGAVDTLFNKTCREDKVCSPSSWIFQNSSLTHEDVTNSNHLNNFHDEIQKIFNVKPVTSYNQGFDFRILEHPSRNFVIPLKFWDPMLVLTDYLKIPSPSGGFRYKWPTLQEALEYFNLDEKIDQKHRAIYDARKEAELIFQAVKKWPVLINKWTDYIG